MVLRIGAIRGLSIDQSKKVKLAQGHPHDGGDLWVLLQGDEPDAPCPRVGRDRSLNSSHLHAPRPPGPEPVRRLLVSAVGVMGVDSYHRRMTEPANCTAPTGARRARRSGARDASGRGGRRSFTVPPGDVPLDERAGSSRAVSRRRRRRSTRRGRRGPHPRRIHRPAAAALFRVRRLERARLRRGRRPAGPHLRHQPRGRCAPPCRSSGRPSGGWSFIGVPGRGTAPSRAAAPSGLSHRAAAARELAMPGSRHAGLADTTTRPRSTTR